MRWHPEIKSEQELCHIIRPIFEADGTVLYPEIMGMDYVGIKDENYIAIEVKTKLCSKVVEQAWTRRRSGLVNGATIVVPDKQFVRANKLFWTEICSKLGIGIITYTFGRLKTVVHMDLLMREKDDLETICRPEALNHTEAGKPSCKRWGELDVIQCKYVECLQNTYTIQPGISLDAAIAQVQPEFVGKRGKVLQKGRDYVVALILTGRWQKLRLQDGMLYLSNA